MAWLMMIHVFKGMVPGGNVFLDKAFFLLPDKAGFTAYANTMDLSSIFSDSVIHLELMCEQKMR